MVGIWGIGSDGEGICVRAEGIEIESEKGIFKGVRGTFCKPKKKSAKQLLGRLLYVDQASLKVLLTSALKKQKLSVLSNGLSLFLLSGMYFAEFQGI